MDKTVMAEGQKHLVLAIFHREYQSGGRGITRERRIHLFRPVNSRQGKGLPAHAFGDQKLCEMIAVCLGKGGKVDLVEKLIEAFLPGFWQ